MHGDCSRRKGSLIDLRLNRKIRIQTLKLYHDRDCEIKPEQSKVNQVNYGIELEIEQTRCHTKWSEVRNGKNSEAGEIRSNAREIRRKEIFSCHLRFVIYPCFRKLLISCGFESSGFVGNDKSQMTHRKLSS